MTCMLLQKGADPNVTNKSDISPITIAKRMNYSRIIKLLIKFGATPPLTHEKVFGNASTGDISSQEKKHDAQSSLVGPPKINTDIGYSHKTSSGQQQDGISLFGMIPQGFDRVSGDVLSPNTNRPKSLQSAAQIFGDGQSPNSPTSNSMGFVSAMDSIGIDEDMQRRHMFQDSIERKYFSICNAAYLGLKEPLLEVVRSDTIDYLDEAGCTGLMKAAYRGNLDLVKHLVNHGANINAMDHDGNTPLIWSIVNGHAQIVKYLVEDAKVDIHNEKQNQFQKNLEEPNSDRSNPLLTPLIVAVHGGYQDISEYLLRHGVDVNERAGPGRGRTALMVAAWMRRKTIVQLLLQYGAHIEPSIDSWLTKGMIYLKKVAVEQNAWLGHATLESSPAETSPLRRDMTSVSTFTLNAALLPSGGSVSGTPMQQRRASLQEKFVYFSHKDSECASEIMNILLNHGKLLVKSNTDNQIKTERLHSASVGSTEPSSSRPSSLLGTRGNLQRRRNNTFRQGLNLDKIIGNNSSSVLTLAEQMPDRGTELDGLWIAVFQCVVQLVIAANKNIKHQYIAISAKAIHCSSEIIRAIEMIDKSCNSGIKNGGSSNAANTPVSAFSTMVNQSPTGQVNLNASWVQGASGTSKPSGSAAVIQTEGSLFSYTPVRSRMRHLARIISNEFPKQLMLSTRMAIGVWPPPDAVAEMIREAAALAASCRDIVLLANTLGHYPILDKNFEVLFNAFEDGQDQEREVKSDIAATSQDKDARPKGALSYSEYKRQNDLKLIEEMSKRYDMGGRQASHDVLTPEEKSTDLAFFQTLDALLKQFVVSVAELKNVHDQHLKEEFIKATSTVHARADTLMEEINSFEFLKDFPDDVVIDQEDAIRLESSGVRLPITIFPCPIKPFYLLAFEEVKNSARQVMAKGKIASASWPPPNSAAEMLQATIPCVIAVKKLVILAKESSGKVRQTHLEDRRKRDNWRKECLQNERVKKLFQMWESQLLGDENPIFKKPSALLTMDELKVLEDSTEGLVLEEMGGKRQIKGGTLTKLLEAATGHDNNDEDFTAAFILTHHSFTTSSELLDQLFKRYEIAPPYGLSQRIFEIYIDKKVVQVRLRVCHVLQYWIQNHFEEDFVEYDQFILRYRDFVEKKVKFDFEQLSITMLEVLEKKLAEDFKFRPTPQISSDREKLCPKVILSQRSFAVGYPVTDVFATLGSDPKAYLEVDPQEMARQLTLVEFELFSRVKPFECLDQIWDGHRRKENLALKGSNYAKRQTSGEGSISEISRLIQHTNQISFWIATNIVTQETPKARMNIIKYFVQVAMHCRELNNLTGVTTIIGALSMSPISRLHKTWKVLEDKYLKMAETYKEIADLVSPKFQYANYRKALKEMQPPAIPFLGVYLTDLTFLELGNPDFLPDTHFVNFDKRRKVYNLIKDIQRYAQVPFALNPLPPVQEFLKKIAERRGTPVGWEEFPLFTEDELYEQSLIVEPKEPESGSDED
ncbi:hypothetical protein RTP6_004701 [Batrachochytrium dendrobatidis]